MHIIGIIGGPIQTSTNKTTMMRKLWHRNWSGERWINNNVRIYICSDGRLLLLLQKERTHFYQMSTKSKP